MLEYFKTTETGFQRIEEPEVGCWVSAVAPTASEREFLINHIGVLPEFVKSSLDEEESSHIDFDDDLNQTLVIIDYPSVEGSGTDVQYVTCPMGVVVMKGYVVTISLFDNWSIQEFRKGHLRGLDTRLKTRFLLMLLLSISQRFLICLRQIDRLSTITEARLRQSMGNEDLLQLLNLEESLVYFSTSLKSDEVTLNKIHRGRQLKLYEEDEDLLEDVLIEMHQANEMCSIYSNILSGMRDAFSSVISNNTNNAMKMLAILTAVLSIPNIIFGFYGMNVKLPVPYVWFPSLICVLACFACWIWLLKGKMFR